MVAMVPPVRLEERCRDCLLHGAIEGLQDGLVLVDPRGRVFHVNRRARDLIGGVCGGAVGMAVGRILREPALAAFWAAESRSREPATAELVLPAGSGRAVRATLVSCLGAGGAPIGRALLLRDVT